MVRIPTLAQHGIRLAIWCWLANHLPTVHQAFWENVNLWWHFQHWPNICIRLEIQHWLPNRLPIISSDWLVCQCWANIGKLLAMLATIANIGPMLDCYLSGWGPMSSQRLGDIESTFSQRWGDVGPTFFANNMPTFWSTFCQLSANLLTILWLLIFPYNVHHVRHIFSCRKDVQKMSYFKACFGTCLEAWHSHGILKTSG